MRVHFFISFFSYQARWKKDSAGACDALVSCIFIIIHFIRAARFSDMNMHMHANCALRIDCFEAMQVAYERDFIFSQYYTSNWISLLWLPIDAKNKIKFLTNFCFVCAWN